MAVSCVQPLVVVAVLLSFVAASAERSCGGDHAEARMGQTQPCTDSGLQFGGVTADAMLQGPRRMLLQAAAPPQTAPAVPSPDELCSDHPPPGKYGCDEQRDFDKCWADFMIAGDFCKRTCGRCQGQCNDIQPPGDYTCAQQKDFDKCDEHYIRDWGYCAATCERCDVMVASSRPEDQQQTQDTTAPDMQAAAAPEVADSSAKGPSAGSQGGKAAAPQMAPAPKQKPFAEPITEAPTDMPTGAPTMEPTLSPAAAAAALDDAQQADEQQAVTPAPVAHHDNDGDDGHVATKPAVHHEDNDGDDAAATQAAGGVVVISRGRILEYVHGILMMSAFGVIIPLGVFTSRYGKLWKHWFNTHRAVQTIGWIVAAAGFVLALTMHKLADWMEEHEAAPTGRRLLHAGHDHAAVHDAAWQKRHKIYLVHKYVGIAVFVLVSLQLTSLFKRPGQKSKLRATWAWAHWLAGWGLLTAALFNNWEGLVLLQPISNWYFIGYAALLAVIVGIVLVAEARRCIYGHQLEGYKQAGEDGGLELVGGTKEERQGLTADDDMDGGGANGHRFDLAEDEDDEELAFATAKFAKD